MSLVIRPATPADLATVTAPGPKPTVKAMAVEIDGELAGLAGLARYGGRYFAFCDITSAQAAPYKLRIARATQRFLAAQRAAGIRFIYTWPQVEREPRAALWIEHLGFKPDPRHPHLYRWSAD